MKKIDVLLNPPALPDRDLEGFDPAPGARRVRFAAFTRGGTSVVGLTIFRSVLAGLWAPAARLEISGGGTVVHMDLDVEDEREEFVVVAEGNPDRVPANLEVYAEELQPPKARSRRETLHTFDGGGYAAEILEDVRRNLPHAVRAESFPDAVRILKEELPHLFDLRSGVCSLLDIRVTEEGRIPTKVILQELERRLNQPAAQHDPAPPPPPKPTTSAQPGVTLAGDASG